MTNHVLIFGHSHVWSMRRALAEWRDPSATTDFEVILCGTMQFPGPLVTMSANDKMLINPCLVAALAKAREQGKEPQASWLVSMVQGNFYNTLGLLKSGEDYDFVIPERADLPLNRDARLLPYRAVLQRMRETMSEMKSFLSLLPTLGYSNIVQINAPPPVESEEYIRNDLSSKNALQDDDAVNPPVLRLKLWLVQRTIMQEICDELGVRCLQPPEDACDAQGFLKQEYWKDAVHASREYASLQLDQLSKIVNEGAHA